MKLRTALVALTLVLSPGFAFAFSNCSSGHDEQTVSSCIDGFVWDASAQTCVKRATS